MIRQYMPEDYPLLCEWWKFHKWEPVIAEVLPNTGFIMEHESVPMCAGFIYLTSTPLCWLEFLIANPKGLKAHRSNCLDELISHMLDFAKGAGAKHIFTSVAGAHSRLKKRMRDHGFSQADTNVTHFLRNM